MFRSYFKIAIRSLLRERGYAAINVAGLAIGMTVVILVSLYAKHDLSYDLQAAFPTKPSAPSTSFQHLPRSQEPTSRMTRSTVSMFSTSSPAILMRQTRTITIPSRQHAISTESSAATANGSCTYRTNTRHLPKSETMANPEVTRTHISNCPCLT